MIKFGSGGKQRIAVRKLTRERKRSIIGDKKKEKALESIKKMKIWRAIKTILYLILAVFVAVFFDWLLENVRYVVGPLMILYGTESIVMHFVLKRKVSEENEFFWGEFEVMLGVVLLLADGISYESTCIIWAIWSIFRETRELEEIFKRIEKKIPVILDLAESVCSIIISVVLIINPGEKHIAVHAIFLIVELVSTVLLPYFREYYEKRRKEQTPKTLKGKIDEGERETLKDGK